MMAVARAAEFSSLTEADQKIPSPHVMTELSLWHFSEVYETDRGR